MLKLAGGSAVRASVVVLFLLSALVLSSGQPAMAEQVEKKWRLSAAIGSFNGDDDVQSDAANTLVLRSREFDLDFVFRDPRDDSAVFNTLGIESSPLVTFAAQYAVNNIFMVEGSVGYQKGDLGDIEIQAQFERSEFDEIPFNFKAFFVDAGELTRIPIMLTGIARLRPRASFNPYFGGGIGYSVVGYETSEEFDQLSVAMDSSIGAQMSLSPDFPGNPVLSPPPPSAFQDLEGARVEARDTFEWHVTGGAEYGFRRGLAVFLDARYTLSSRTVRFGFNRGESLGIPVPQLADFSDQPVAFETFGAVQISQGGLVDAGQVVLVPMENFPPTTNCQAQPQFCEEDFIEMPDGVLDPGLYYVQGGEFAYDGLSVSVGLRYTFK